ncbi:MAG: TolC family protein [Myxococcaceae bacterium]|nr:TolC family protein [Myxococcaceae bacterium]
MRTSVFLLLVVTAGHAVGAPLTLPELVERARKNDARVRESQAQLAWFRAKYDEARWAWFPRVESYVAVAGPTPEARNDGLGGPPRTAASLMYDLDFGQVGVQFRAGAEAVLPIYTFGKLDALEAAGAKGVQAGEALAVRAADEAELQVSQAFWGLSLARAGVGVIDETVKRLDEAKATLERLRSLDSEQVTQMDVYKLDFYRQQAEVQRAAARQGESFALAAIRLLIAHPPTEPLEVATEALPEPRGGLDPVDALLEQALAHRPELRAVEAGVAAREQEVKLRERMYYPDFGIAGFARWVWTTSATRQRSPFAYDPYNDLSAGLALVSRYTWDFPQKSALLDGARAELDKMRAQRDLIRAGVRLELEKAWGEVSAAQVRFERQTLAEKSARRWATAAFAAFDLGTGDTRDLVESFTALASASAQRAQAQHDVQVALKALSRAVGQPVLLQVPYDVSPLPPPSAVTSPPK